MISEKPITALSGVRSSWLMLARNSLLALLADRRDALGRLVCRIGERDRVAAARLRGAQAHELREALVAPLDAARRVGDHDAVLGARGDQGELVRRRLAARQRRLRALAAL